MIWLTKITGKKFAMNCEWIKYVESTPDTVITLTTGDKLMVSESVEDVIQKTIHYKQTLNQKPIDRLFKENEKEKV